MKTDYGNDFYLVTPMTDLPPDPSGGSDSKPEPGQERASGLRRSHRGPYGTRQHSQHSQRARGKNGDQGVDAPAGSFQEKKPDGNRSSHQKRSHNKSGGRRSGRYDKRQSAFGAVDLGTNNCRLLVATPQAGGFRVIDAFSRIVGLGEGLERERRFSDEAMDRAISALTVCSEKLKRRRVGVFRAVATEACRLADNRGEFIDRVRDVTGIALDIISPAEEARLAVGGCQPLMDPNKKYAVVFDIGGGSTEVVAAELIGNGTLNVVAWTSLPIGVVRLSDRLGGELDQPQYDEIVTRISLQVGEFAAKLGWQDNLARGQVQMLGSSGTVTTMASHQLGLLTYDRSKVDGAILDRMTMREMSRNVALMSAEDRANIPSIGLERSRLVAPGCLILDALLKPWDITELRIADRGIREGILRGLMKLGRVQGTHTGGTAS